MGPKGYFRRAENACRGGRLTDNIKTILDLHELTDRVKRICLDCLLVRYSWPGHSLNLLDRHFAMSWDPDPRWTAFG